MRKIILASGSKARKELLKILIGNNFEVQKSEYEEDNSLKLSPEKLTMFLSLNKARDVAKKNKEGIVIGADTLVFLGKKVCGKPKNKNEAIKMLSMLSGKTHTVVTGIAIIDVEKKLEFQDCCVTKVTFGKLTRKEIVKYINSHNVLENSGSYGFTDISSTFIEKIDGDYYSVVGLPLYKLYKLLEKCGIDLYKFK